MAAECQQSIAQKREDTPNSTLPHWRCHHHLSTTNPNIRTNHLSSECIEQQWGVADRIRMQIRAVLPKGTRLEGVRSRNVLCPALFKLHNKRRNACNYVVSGDIRIAGREEWVKFVIKDHTFQASLFDMTISQRAPKSNLLG